MSEAVMNLITRDAVELHFEGATYGPVAHTESLGVLLHVLAPSTVRCIASGPAFERAMRRLLAAARAVCSDLDDPDGEAAVDEWLVAAWRAVPAERAADFRRRCAEQRRRRPAAARH